MLKQPKVVDMLFGATDFRLASMTSERNAPDHDDVPTSAMGCRIHGFNYDSASDGQLTMTATCTCSISFMAMWVNRKQGVLG